MERASALLQFVRDADAGGQSSNLSENDLIHKLNSVKKQLQHSGGSETPPESIALAVCHCTNEVMAFLVQHRPVPAQTASAKWNKRVFLLETAVASAFTTVTSSGDADLELITEDTRDFCYMCKFLLSRLWMVSKSPQQEVNAAAVMNKWSVLLAICWLSYDRVGKMTKAEELLKVCSDFCSKHKSTRSLAKWPLFLLGMVKMVEMQDCDGALQCFRGVVEKSEDGSVGGVFFYWYSVALIRNGLLDDAVIALDKCIRTNYEPVHCLSLQALVNLQAKDFHAANGQLQRAIEIDGVQSNSLFNYALLMQRMENFETQQQLLQYVLEFHGGSQGGHGKSKGSHDNADAVGTTQAATCLFDNARLASLLPSQLACVNFSMVHFHLAVAAMDNSDWLESKKQFEAFLSLDCQRIPQDQLLKAAGDYVYVLLQCKLPSLALRSCERYLQEFEKIKFTDAVALSWLLLHLYKADSMLCLERVGECYEYLKQTVQPKIQDAKRRPNDSQMTESIFDEIVSCHTQLLNNLAVVMACHNDVDGAISILREGLQQYPECLAIKFNLVLLLWRKGDKAAASSVWIKARAWNLQAKTSDVESKATGNGANRSAPLAVYGNISASTRDSQTACISEHVQDLTGESGVSAQQLDYLDALILNYWRKTRNCMLTDNTLQYVEYIESLGSTNTSRQD